MTLLMFQINNGQSVLNMPANSNMIRSGDNLSKRDIQVRSDGSLNNTVIYNKMGCHRQWEHCLVVSVMSFLKYDKRK